MKKRILTLVCTLAIAFCSVLGFNSIRNVENVSVHATETELTDLTNTRWYFNEVLNSSIEAGGSFVFSINFYTDANTKLYSGLKCEVSSLGHILIYLISTGGQSTALRPDGSWLGKNWRYITIHSGADVNNFVLIDFMQRNAVRLEFDPVDPPPADSSSSSSSDPVDPPPADSSSSSSSDPVDPPPADSSSSSSSDPVDPPPADSSSGGSSDEDAVYGIFNNASLQLRLYTLNGNHVLRFPVFDVNDFSISFSDTYDYLYNYCLGQGILLESIVQVDFIIKFEIPVSIGSFLSLGVVGLDSELQGSTWFGLADNDYKVSVSDPKNVTLLEWRSFEILPGENKWFMRVDTNSTVYSNYIGLYFTLFDIDWIKDLALYVPFDGGYTEGYNQGVLDGYDVGVKDGYETGLTDGHENGYKEGHRIGYDDGYAKGMLVANSFVGLMTAVVEAPIKSFLGLTNFEILGYNMQTLALSLLTAALVVCVIRLFSKGGS